MDTKDWNYDRAFTAHAMLHSVNDDLMRTVHKGAPSQGVIDRMADMLRKCADEVGKMRAL
jgi:hypothetical protein